jgi:hypothetical protein
MGKSTDSRRHGARRRKGRIDGKAMGVFLTEIRRGARLDAAARAAGFSRSAFHRLCQRDGEFARLYADALSFSSGPRYICPGKGRPLQLRRNRRVTFTDERKAAFLSRFAGTCNFAAAAEAAGVCESTVFNHLHSDPAFAEGFRAAMPIGYMRLEAALVQRRIEAQERLKAIAPSGEPEPEFERALKLLQRWERKDGTLGPKGKPGKIRQWSFDEAIDALERKLKAVGIPIAEAPDEKGEPA